MKALVLFVTTIVLAGCSADEFKNPQRKDPAQCRKLGGDVVGGRFCVDGGASDAGGGMDAGAHDAASDSGASDAGGDARPPEPCDTENASERCYDADDQATALQLPCMQGTRECHGGTWGLCIGEVLPMPETCNGEDDDCDGKTDEEQAPDVCMVENQQGACQIGVSLCRPGAAVCAQVTFPQTDVCDDKDNDCDGHVDEHTELACPAAAGCSPRPGGGYDCVGNCKVGFKACVRGAYSDTCKGSVEPDTEKCTSAGGQREDEDCDGKVDEGCSCTNGDGCYSGSVDTRNVGPCHAGTLQCTDPTHGTCMNEVKPKPEDCSNLGVDDDCDGTVDNVPMLGTSCSDVSSANGMCKTGATWTCSSGKLVCTDATAGSAELCDGQMVDEDCDGTADEGFSLADDDNCGKCGRKCGAGSSCCGGECVSMATSNANCGACGNSCASGSTCCSSTCRNTHNDKNNCGSCGNACTGLKSCNNGSCVLLGI